MIPFARVIKYGNNVSTPKIKKVFAGSVNVYVLFENGKLYGCGQNSQYQLGNYPAAIQSSWVLVRDDVVDAWAGVTSLLCYLGNGNSWHFYGTRAVLGDFSGNAGPSGFDPSATMPNYSNVYLLSIGELSMHYVAANKNRIYGRGLNTNYTIGGGLSGPSDVFTDALSLGGATVEDIQTNNTNTMILSSTGEVRGCGLSTYGSMGVAVGTYTTMAIRDPSGTQLMSSSAQSTILFKGGGISYIAGWQLYGQLGNGLETNVTIYPFRSNPVSVDADIIAVSRSCSTGQVAMYCRSTGEVYTTGIASRSGSGTTTNTTTFTRRFQFDTGFDASKVTLYTNSYTSIAFDGKDLWGVASNVNYLPGLSGAGKVFEKINLPSGI